MDDLKIKFMIIIFMMTVVALVFLIFSIGYQQGLNDMREIQEEVDCEMADYQTFDEIPQRCYKHLKLEKLKT